MGQKNKIIVDCSQQYHNHLRGFRKLSTTTGAVVSNDLSNVPMDPAFAHCLLGQAPFQWGFVRD